MIFDLLKRRWLREEYLNYDARKEARLLKWPESLLVIVDTSKDQDVRVFKDWYRKLDITFKEVTIIGRCKNVKNSPVSDMDLVDGSFIKWFGGVTDMELAATLDRPVDLQINYFDEESMLTHYLARRANAAFRVGFSHHSEETYDLGLNMATNEPDTLIAEVTKYLKILTT
jgi:hypothetical protein